MVKRWLLVGGILLLVSSLVIGCGIPKEDYEAVVAEKDSAVAELQSVNNQLDNVQTEVSDLQAEVSDLQAEVSDLQGEVSDLGSELEEKQQQLSEVQQILDSLEPKLQMQALLAEYSNKQAAWWSDQEEYSFDEWWDYAHDIFRMDIEKYLQAIDEPILRVHYEQAVIWKADDWLVFTNYYEKLLNSLGELIEADKAELETALAD